MTGQRGPSGGVADERSQTEDSIVARPDGESMPPALPMGEKRLG
jgi:hypothetical protein